MEITTSRATTMSLFLVCSIAGGNIGCIVNHPALKRFYVFFEVRITPKPPANSDNSKTTILALLLTSELLLSTVIPSPFPILPVETFSQHGKAYLNKGSPEQHYYIFYLKNP
jgi:hypothetical protein